MVFQTMSAKVSAISLLVALVATLIGVSVSYGVIPFLFALFLITPISLLVVYDINCLIMGQCNVWSWIKTVCTIIYAIGVVIGVSIELISSKKTTKITMNVQDDKGI